MRTLAIIILCIVLVVGAGIAFCKLNYPTYTYRYRMTVDVTVDGVVHSGSSVIEVSLTRQPRVLPDVLQVVPHTIGEAVFIDLGGGRNVIALLASGPNGSNSNYPDQIVPRLFRINILNDSELSKIAGLRGRREIPEQDLPTFVTFTDLNDPKTARVVRPGEFARVFGAGVRFKGAWIEMADEPVTRDIENKLSWWRGPFPWLKPLGAGTYVDTRRDGFRWQKEMFKRGS